MKTKLLTFISLVAITAYSYVVPNDKIAFRVTVLDERTKSPLANIPVTAVFTDVPMVWGGRSVDREERGLTDANGVCRFTGSSNNAWAGYVVGKQAGFYATPWRPYVATNRVRHILTYRCEPYDCMYTTVMQRVEHPIPLCVRQVHLRDRKNCIGGFDGTNAVLRYDFIVGDWLPPHGNGKYADIVIRTSYRLNETLKDRLNDGLTFYEFMNEIEFAGEGNGLVEKSPSDVNCGIKIREALELGYVHGKTLRFGRRRKETKAKGIWPDVYTECNKDRCYCFRIRSRFDDKGKLIEAYYGKIYGDFNFEGWDKPGLVGIEFLYYLNPTPLDRNLEWDMKNNLCPNPGNVGKQP